MNPIENFFIGKVIYDISWSDYFEESPRTVAINDILKPKVLIEDIMKPKVLIEDILKSKVMRSQSSMDMLLSGNFKTDMLSLNLEVENNKQTLSKTLKPVTLNSNTLVDSNNFTIQGSSKCKTKSIKAASMSLQLPDNNLRRSNRIKQNNNNNLTVVDKYKLITKRVNKTNTTFIDYSKSKNKNQSKQNIRKISTYTQKGRRNKNEIQNSQNAQKKQIHQDDKLVQDSNKSLINSSVEVHKNNSFSCIAFPKSKNKNQSKQDIRKIRNYTKKGRRKHETQKKIQDKLVQVCNKSLINSSVEVHKNNNHLPVVSEVISSNDLCNTKITARKGTLKYLVQRDKFLSDCIHNNDKDMDLFDSSFGKKNKALDNLWKYNSNESLTIKTPKEKDKFKGAHYGLTPRSAMLNELETKLLCPTLKQTPLSKVANAKNKQGALEVLYHHLKQNNSRKIKKDLEKSDCYNGKSDLKVKHQVSKILEAENDILTSIPQKISDDQNDSFVDDYFNESA